MHPIAAVPVVSPTEAAAWDRAAEAAGFLAAALMENAGRGAAQVVATRFGDALSRGVLIACGAGNNGGDGWVMARALHRQGVPVWVAAVPAPPSPLSALVAGFARSDGVREVPVDGPWPAVGLIVDALLGTGAHGALREPIRALVDRLGDLHLPVVAIDGPTGLNLSDGVSHGALLRADLTVTFGGYRRGHLLARDDVGPVVVLDIGLPPSPAEWPALLTDQGAADLLPAWAADAHKGTRGRVVVIGGDAGLTGAPRLAARAALMAGAGVVTAVAPSETISILAAAEPDLLTHGHPLTTPLAPPLRALLERADAVVIGPGLGRQPERFPFVAEVLTIARRAVIDADALTVLQGEVPELADVGAAKPLVLTPHAGEFRTLFPHLAAGAGVDPWEAAAAAARESGATVVLKGVPTVVATPLGRVMTIASGNPGLATGGSGDTLSGLVAAFLGQDMDPGSAAALGAHILGRAADLAAGRRTARSLRPMDVIAALPDLWRSWDQLRRNPPRPFPPVLHELEAPLRA